MWMRMSYGWGRDSYSWDQEEGQGDEGICAVEDARVPVGNQQKLFELPQGFQKRLKQLLPFPLVRANR